MIITVRRTARPPKKLERQRMNRRRTPIAALAAIALTAAGMFLAGPAAAAGTSAADSALAQLRVTLVSAATAGQPDAATSLANFDKMTSAQRVELAAMLLG